MVDISVDVDQSFLLSNGLISHNSAGSPMRQFRNSQTQGFFCLRGKFINVSEIEDRKVIENKEAFNLMQAIGLEWNQKIDKSKLRYGKLIIATDADVDGDSITGLLLNFFSKWPELFELGLIYKCLTPLMVVENNKTKHQNVIYTQEEYNDFLLKNNIKDFYTHYKKGIGSLEDNQFKEIVRSPKLVKYELQENCVNLLYTWFGKDPVLRKNELLST